MSSLVLSALILALFLIVALVLRYSGRYRSLSPARPHDLAKLLVSEIALHNDEALGQARRQRDIYRVLETEIETARLMYRERVPEEDRKDWFEQALVEVLALGEPQLLGDERRWRKETPAESDEEG